MITPPALRAAVVVPYYRHPNAIAKVLADLAPYRLPTFLVNDGSGPNCEAQLAVLANTYSDWLNVIHRPQNGGKGAATMQGFAAAEAAGCTHALQVDADGQHAIDRLPAFIDAAKRAPSAVIAGCPQYDDSVPRHRLIGRYATHIWVWINTLSFAIKDSMCGFRLYPIAPALSAWQRMRWGRRMDFDTEIIVRMHWAGVPVQNLPVPVRYPADGVSHFAPWADNVRISAMHTRLFFGMLWRAPRLLARRLKA